MVKGLPVVFVHGTRVSGACWVRQVELLRGDHPVATPDLPGHGARRGERFTLDRAVATVLDAIDRIAGRTGRALVVGHSLGGYVAIAAAGRHPTRVAGLVPVGCTLVPSPGLLAPFRVGSRLLSLWPDHGERVNARLFRRALPAEVAEPMIAAGLANEIIGEVLAEVSTSDPIGDLARYPGVTRLVNGRYDHFRLQERRFLEGCRLGALTVVPGAGHFLPLTFGERFARLVRDQAELIGSTVGSER